MKRVNLWIVRVMLTTLLLTMSLAVACLPAFADSASGIDIQVQAAMEKLYAGSPEALEFSKTAKGILVFPDVVKAGLGIGGQFGEGGSAGQW